MTLSIKSFSDVGDIDNERLVLRADDQVDIGNYIVLRSKTNSEGDAISGSKDAYWFPDLTVAKGDLVVLYSRTGKAGTKKLQSGGMAHFFYWHKKNAMWGRDKNNIAVLLDAPTWESKMPNQG